MTFKVFIIAGESSGDVLGASLIEALRAQRPDLELRGIGGAQMLAAGLKESFFPMEELSVMGIAEILPRIPKFIGLIHKTVAAIRGFNPDVVVTIDSPDFSFRVQKKVRKENISARQIHYVAPTVWAWRPGRAQKISQFLDGLICLFPFEPPYFEREGLQAISVGHPMVTSGLLEGDGKIFRQKYNFSPDRKLVGLLCGSRGSELDMSVPIMREMIVLLRDKCPDTAFIVPTLPKWHDRLTSFFEDISDVLVTSVSDEKYHAFRACDAAAVVSGTAALEIALAGVPHVLFYKMNKVTWEIVRRLVKSKYAHLGNILLNRKEYQEFLQDDVNVETIVDRLQVMLSDPERAVSARRLSDELKDLLSPNPNEEASVQAARFTVFPNMISRS
ncbi:MAG: lipid-A-disaccharide synthase [Alphaproteobacteria bacterium]|nr:lipid-A-disaccharide synthase [Alphaproteobacteria bacterium]